MKLSQAALPSLSLAHPLALLSELAGLAENMGGSSGGIYSILLTTASRAFKDQVKILIVKIVSIGMMMVLRLEGRLIPLLGSEGCDSAWRLS